MLAINAEKSLVFKPYLSKIFLRCNKHVVLTRCRFGDQLG